MTQSRGDEPRFGSLLAAILCLNVVGAQILHEAGHWLVLTVTGRQPVWGLTSLVQLWETTPQTPAAWTPFTEPGGSQGWLHLSSLPASDGEWAAFLLGGPLAQLLAIAVGLYLAARATSSRWRTFGRLLALINAFGHTFYQVVSSLRSGGGGDETLIACDLNVPWPLVTLLFGGLAAAGLVIGFRQLPAGQRRRWLGALFLGTLPVGPLFMIFNGMIIDGVDAGAAFYRPVLGFSLPVLLLALITAAGVFGLSRRWAADERPPA